MSSIGQIDQEVASKNSIISEEDSAFEDQTPANNKKNNKITRTDVKIQKQLDKNPH